MAWPIITLGVVVGIGIVSALYYNSFITLKTRVDNSFSQIDVQLKRRQDLIPNLVETVKGYTSHEKKLLENVTKARSAMSTAGTMNEKAKASNMLSSTLKSLFAVVENYPELKADKNFQQLQNELKDTEDKIAYSRQFYNDTVMRWNESIARFPGNIVASMFHFTTRQYFEASASDREAVKVKF